MKFCNNLWTSGQQAFFTTATTRAFFAESWFHIRRRPPAYTRPNTPKGPWYRSTLFVVFSTNKLKRAPPAADIDARSLKPQPYDSPAIAEVPIFNTAYLTAFHWTVEPEDWKHTGFAAVSLQNTISTVTLRTCSSVAEWEANL
ncbi:hypothetical protein IFR04_008058 [Cadophora malorum]|uniref:Uncharacterized protein n=1 Tax=Cadophora malorum TaxID=108018 RepID=A0A8H7TH17_9HELO|nr:hypothetical protein IFR04_008058 [Cadophora malorum]